jgi:hypothetical protein
MGVLEHEGLWFELGSGFFGFRVWIYEDFAVFDLDHQAVERTRGGAGQDLA